MPRRSPNAPELGPGVQAVLLVLEIIEHLAKQESAGVTEIAKALGSTKARVHRHLRTLLDTGYAVQEAAGDRYRAGPRLTVLAEMRMSENVLVKVARPIMQRLREAMGHTITLARVTGSVANMVEALQGNGLINIGVRVGLDLPLHANAGGKLVLAFGAPEVGAEIERVRQQGWANAPEEFVIGVNALSAPIFDKSHRLIGTLGLVNSIQFLGRRPTAEQIANVAEAAEEITQHLMLAR